MPSPARGLTHRPPAGVRELAPDNCAPTSALFPLDLSCHHAWPLLPLQRLGARPEHRGDQLLQPGAAQTRQQRERPARPPGQIAAPMPLQNTRGQAPAPSDPGPGRYAPDQKRSLQAPQTPSHHRCGAAVPFQGSLPESAARLVLEEQPRAPPARPRLHEKLSCSRMTMVDKTQQAWWRSASIN